MACTLDKVGARRDEDGELFAASCRHLTQALCIPLQMLIKGIRSFSPDNQAVIEFYRPLTLIVGHNGAGKTVRRQGGGEWPLLCRLEMHGRLAWSSAGSDNAMVELAFETRANFGSKLAKNLHLHASKVPRSTSRADHHRVPEDGVHRRAATQHPIGPELHPRPQGRRALGWLLMRWAVIA